MSLHLANISPRIQRDEIERVFRRFGRCFVQLKTGYGFADFDVRGDAEKALRFLNGRKICGESIKISWSSKQPKSLQRFSKSGRICDVELERNSDRGLNDTRLKSSKSRENYSVRHKHPDDEIGIGKSSEIKIDTGSLKHNDKKIKPYNRRRESLEEGGHLGPIQVEYGRRGEQHDNFRSGNKCDPQMRSDKYDPKTGDDAGEKYEKFASVRLAGSPVRDQRDNAKTQRGCFKCGAAGHKMRDCPLKEATQGKSSYRSEHRLENKVKTKAGGGAGRLQSCIGSSISDTRREADRKLLLAEKNEAKGSGSQFLSESKRRTNEDYNKKRQREKEDQALEAHDNKKSSKPLLEEKNQIKGGGSQVLNESSRLTKKDYNRKRQREQEDQALEAHADKKSRVLSAHSHSDHMPPELDTHQSIKAFQGSSMRSRSPSLASNCCSDYSMSKSRSNRSRSGSIISRSRSRSPKNSLPISLHQPSTSSANREKLSLNDVYVSVSSPQSKEVPSEAGDQFHPEVREEPSFANREETGFSGCIDNTRSHQLKEIRDSKEDTPTLIKYPELCVNSALENDQAPQSENVALEEEDLCEPESTYVFKYQKVTDAPEESKDLSSEVEALNPTLLKEGDKNIDVGEIVAEIPEKQQKNDKSENANILEISKFLGPENKMDLNVQSKLYHLSISKEEFWRVLKHYGLKDSQDNKEHLGVEDYFGSARLWPWEMIYYRRLKKGSISVENYARRLDQNNAFGITDKYIRSSSGWGELIDELP